jgi:hypothetical protein
MASEVTLIDTLLTIRVDTCGYPCVALTPQQNGVPISGLALQRLVSNPVRSSIPRSRGGVGNRELADRRTTYGGRAQGNQHRLSVLGTESVKGNTLEERRRGV